MSNRNIRRNKTPASILTLEQCRLLPKIVHHEHYDCSIRPEHVLSVGTNLNLDIPVQYKQAWRQAGDNRVLQTRAVTDYQNWLQGNARESLTNYLNILWAQVLPTLQTGDDIYNTAKQRIEDAVADGMIFLKLRFAPQLHRRLGLKLQQVIDPLQQAVSEAPFPVRLVICALRHENGRLARHLADAVIRNPYVDDFDLAGDESKFPGVLPWWAKQAARVYEAGKHVLCHIGEACPITDADHDALDAIGCVELGHAIKGDPRDKLCTVCFISNLVTSMAESAEKHVIDAMYNAGRMLNIDPDGTLLTGADLSCNYHLISQTFGWGLEHFYRCNLNGLKYVHLSSREKRKIKKQLDEGFRQAGLRLP